jgi:hypothetical protein
MAVLSGDPLGKGLAAGIAGNLIEGVRATEIAVLVQSAQPE